MGAVFVLFSTKSDKITHKMNAKTATADKNLAKMRKALKSLQNLIGLIIISQDMVLCQMCLANPSHATNAQARLFMM